MEKAVVGGHSTCSELKPKLTVVVVIVVWQATHCVDGPLFSKQGPLMSGKPLLHTCQSGDQEKYL